MEKRRFYLEVVVLFVLLISSLSFVVAVDDLMAIQGNVQEAGVDLASGDVVVSIYDSYSGGNLIYNSTSDFDGAVVDGKYDVLVGNGTNELSLEYGKVYYLELYVDGEKFSFNGLSRQAFQSSVGQINGTYINSGQVNGTHIIENVVLRGDVSVTGNLSVTNNISADTGFFNLAWSYLTSVPSLVYDIWTGNNANSLLVSNGTAIGYNESVFNSSVLSIGNANGWASTYNATYAGVVLNNSYLNNETYNYNQTTATFSLYNSTWDNRGMIASVNSTGNILVLIGQSFNETASINSINTTENIASLISGGTFSLANLNVTNTLRVGDSFIASSGSGLNITSGEVNIGGSWSDGGVTISDGSLFAQTVYVYNVTSLGVSTLNINGSLLPQGDFDNTFDIGSASLQWRDVYVGRKIYAVDWSNVTIEESQISDLQTDAYLSTYNATYNTWAYNQTYSGSTYNATYDAKNSSRWASDGQNISYSLGNVGIGTASPNATLDVPVHTSTRNTAQFGTFGIQSTEVNNGFLQDNTYWNGTALKYREDGYGAMFQFISGDIRFRFSPLGSAGDSASLSNAVVIKNTGSVGIGTLTPSQTLDVRGAINASGEIYFNNGTAVSSLGGGSSAWVSSGNYLYNDTAFVGIGTDTPSELLTVNGGNVLINATSANQGFYINGTDGYQDAGLYSDGDEGIFALRGDGTNRIYFKPYSDSFVNVGANDFYVLAGGVGIGTNSPSTLLDVGVSNSDVDNYITIGRSGLSEGGLVWDRQGTKDARIVLLDTEKLMISNDFGGDTFFNNTKVGIGTASPSQLLEVQGNISIKEVGETESWIMSTVPSAGHFYFYGDDGSLAYRIIDNTNLFDFAGNDIGGISEFYASNNLPISMFSETDYEIVLDNDNNDPNSIFKINNTLIDNMFVVDEGTGNVGIGTASPSGLFHVKMDTGQILLGDTDALYNGVGINISEDGAISTTTLGNAFATGNKLIIGGMLNQLSYTGSTFNIGDGSATDPIINFDSGNDAYIQWKEDEQDLIISGGNVGIGIVSPTVALNVSGDIGATGNICDGSGNCLNSVTGSGGSSWNFASGKIYNATAGVNVGIGTDSPGYPLTVQGNAYFNPTTSGSVTINDTLQVIDYLLVGSATESDFIAFTIQRGSDSAMFSITGNAGAGFSQGLSIESNTVGGDIAIRNSSDSIHILMDDPTTNVLIPNGKLGIGTISPGARVDINGNLSVATNIHQGDNDRHYFGDSNDASIYWDNANSRLVIQVS